MFLEIFFSVLLLYFVIRPIYLGYRYAHPIRLRISFFTPTSLGVEYDDLVLTTQDGIDLRGWYIHSRNGAAVILLHGHSGNRLAVLHQAEALIRAGYGVLMMDLRAHGHSGGRHFSRSNILVEDVLTAVAYLSKRPEVSAAGIGIYGVSVGGLLALQAASRTVGIRAVMVDDPSPAVFADIPAAGNSWQRWVSFPVQIFYMKITDWFTRQPPLPANSKILPQLAPRSVFFVSTGHGLEQQMVRSLYAAAANQKSIWEIPEARHAAGWREQPDLYDQNLVRFFDNSLVSERDAGVTATPFQPIKATATDLSDLTGYPIAGEVTISFLWANGVALLLLPVAYLLFFVPYQWIWGTGLLNRSLSLDLTALAGILLLVGISIIVHEWIHATAFVWIGGVPKTAVHYGFSWKGMAPYAHCKAPMRASAYRIAVLLPGLLLGIVPGILGVIAGIWWLALWAGLMFVAAGGDTAVLLAMRHLPAQTLVLDHPRQAGCLIIAEE